MGERAVSLLIGCAGIAIAVTVAVCSFLWPQTRVETRAVVKLHPGLRHLPAYDSREELGAITKVCEAWANFDPATTTAFALGQKYQTECAIVRTGPKG